jgi:hypothetical protein
LAANWRCLERKEMRLLKDIGGGYEWMLGFGIGRFAALGLQKCTDAPGVFLRVTTGLIRGISGERVTGSMFERMWSTCGVCCRGRF